MPQVHLQWRIWRKGWDLPLQLGVTHRESEKQEQSWVLDHKAPALSSWRDGAALYRKRSRFGKGNQESRF